MCFERWKGPGNALHTCSAMIKLCLFLSLSLSVRVCVCVRVSRHVCALFSDDESDKSKQNMIKY